MPEPKNDYSLNASESMGNTENRVDNPEHVENIPAFRDILVQTTFNPNRALDKSIQAIDLGMFDNEARDLIARSMIHPNQAEYMKLIYVTPKGTVLIPKEAAEGTENEVRSKSKINIMSFDLSLPKQLRQDRFNAVGIHTHPDDSDPSWDDVGRLFIGDLDPTATTCEFIVTPRRRIVVFKGENTPQLTQEQLKQKLDYWDKVALKRGKQLAKPSMTKQDLAELYNRIFEQMNKEISDKYDLRYFEGATDDQVLKLRT